MQEDNLDPRRQLLMQALYRELDAAEEARFRTLLAEDEALRAEWEELEDARLLLRKAGFEEPAPSFTLLRAGSHRGLLGRLWRPGRPPLSAGTWGFAGAAALLAALVLAGFRVDRVDRGVTFRFGPAPSSFTAESPSSATPSPGRLPSTSGRSPVHLEPVSQVVAPLTRDDLDTYTESMLKAMAMILGEAQLQQKGEMAYILNRFYDEVRAEQDRKYEALRQRVEGVGLGLMAEQTRTNARLSRLLDAGMSELPLPRPAKDTTPRQPNEDEQQ